MFAQFIDSLKCIQKDPETPTLEGISKHVLWQVKKMLNLFPCEVKISNSKILTQSSSCSISALINSRDMYDYDNMSFLQNYLHHYPGIFLDVGANIGSYSLIASEIQKATVISLEPHPVTYNYLVQNIKANTRNNVKTFKIALGDKDGEVLFTNSPGSAINKVVTDQETSNDVIKVDIKQGINFIEQEGLTVKFAKVDAEGYDLAVLKGLGDKCYHDLDFIFVEGNEDRDETFDLLHQKGLKGPYFVHFNDKKLSKSKKVEVPQDFIFFSPSGEKVLEDMHFTIS